VPLVNTELTEKRKLNLIGRLLHSINSWLSGVLVCASSLAKTSAALQLENIALRHQITILQRSASKRRLRLNASDRFLWALLSRVWPNWRSTLVIVKPETVLGWHRKGFGCFGPGKSGAGDRDVRRWRRRFGSWFAR
jgi:hypothetical protein